MDVSAYKFVHNSLLQEAIVGYNSQLADEAVALLTAAWGTGKFPIPKDMEAPCMRVVRLPDLTQFPVKQDPEASVGHFRSASVVGRIVVASWQQFV